MAYTTIDKGSSYFNTVLWTGNNSPTRDITTGHATDFVWVKFRSSAFNHRLFDNVRGGGKRLISNNTNAEDTGATTDVTGFISTGFSIGQNINNSGDGALVGWSWKANGAGSSNNSGTITSTVSANTTAGFSIVSYTGNGTSGATIGHGIGVAPKMIIVKQRSTTRDWVVGHDSIGWNKYLYLNSSQASNTATFFNNTNPSSSIFYVDNDSGVNQNGGTYIAYCFAEVKGYSKFGSYTGNGSTDGTFVYTGFKPAFVLVKNSSTANRQWYIVDNKRSTSSGNNVINITLAPNQSNDESWWGTNNYVDFVSNGFKFRDSYDGFNELGGTYIYMAFAENPFVTSTGLAVTAR